MAATIAVAAQLAFYILFSCLLGLQSSKISDLKLCADRECQETISKAQALANYKSNDPMFLAFKRGDVVSIKSKSAGTRPDLWSGEVNGIRGYFPYAFVREFDVSHRKLEHMVPTEKHLTPGELALKKSEAKVKNTEKETPPIQEQGFQEAKIQKNVVQTDQIQDNDAQKESVVQQKEVEESIVPNDDNVVNMEIDEVEEDETEVDVEPDTPLPPQNTQEEVNEILLPQEEAQKDDTEVDETELSDETEDIEAKPTQVSSSHQEISKSMTNVDETEMVEEPVPNKEDSTWSLKTKESVAKPDNIPHDKIEEAFLHLHDVSSHHVGRESAEDLNKYLVNTFSGGKAPSSEEKPMAVDTVNKEPVLKDTPDMLKENVKQNGEVVNAHDTSEDGENIEEKDSFVVEEFPRYKSDEIDSFDVRLDDDEEDSTEINEDESIIETIHKHESVPPEKKQPETHQQENIQPPVHISKPELSESPPVGNKPKILLPHEIPIPEKEEPVTSTPAASIEKNINQQTQKEAESSHVAPVQPLQSTQTLVNMNIETAPIPALTNTELNHNDIQTSLDPTQAVSGHLPTAKPETIIQDTVPPFIDEVKTMGTINTNTEAEHIKATPTQITQTVTENQVPKQPVDEAYETSQIVIDGTTINLNDDYDNSLLYSSNEIQLESSVPQDPLMKISADVSNVGSAINSVADELAIVGMIKNPDESLHQPDPTINSTEIDPGNPDIYIEPEVSSTTYQSEDYLSRKPLAVNNGQKTQVPEQANDPPSVADLQTPLEREADTTTAQDVKIDETTTLPLVVGEVVPPHIENTDQPVTETYEGETVLSYEDFPPPENTENSFADILTEEQLKENDSKDNTVPTDENPYKTDPVSGRKVNDENLDEDLFGTPLKRNGFIDRSVRPIISMLPSSIQGILEQEPLGLSPALTIIMTISTFLILIISGCCTFSSKEKKKTSDAVVVVRKLEDKLFIVTKEKEGFEDALQEAKREIVKYEKQLSNNQSKSSTYKTDLQNIQLHNESLKQQVNSLQRQIEEYDSEVKHIQGSSQEKDKRVKDLEKQVHKLEERAKKAEKILDKKTKEMQDNIEEVATKTSQMKSLADQLQHLETRKHQLLSEASDWKEKVDDLNERLNQREEEFNHMQETVTFKDSELEVLKECFLQLKAFEDENEMKEDPADGSTAVQHKLQTMIDVAKVNATLRAVQEERDTLSNKLEIETEGRKEVEDQLDKARLEMESFQADKMKAERQNQESQTKLNVLSNYFKEKEIQLQKELGEQEVLKKQNINKFLSADEKSKQTEEERTMYKQQVESLKRELEAAERDFRVQIAANEQKAHENWLAARTAERELKESRHQNTTLRQRLTEFSLKPGSDGLIRPLPTRGLPGMLNGPPLRLPPGVDRPPIERPSSRGSIQPPRPARDDFFGSPHERLPPPDRRLPSGPRFPPPIDGRSPPPFDRRPPPTHLIDRRTPPPHHLDRRTPPYRPPHPDMMPPFRGPPPPRNGHASPSPFRGPPPPHDGPTSPPSLGPPGYDPRLGPRASPPYSTHPPPTSRDKTPRQQSQV